MYKSLLIFTPHPDDHICAAGTILKLGTKGYVPNEVLFTNGETGGQVGKKKVDKQALVKIREKEFSLATKLLGMGKIFKMNQPNNGLAYSQELFFDLIKIIREIRPEIALLPHPEDYHRDHREVSEIAYSALRASDNSFALHLGERYRVPVILYYKGVNPLNHTDFLVDITDHYDQIIELNKVYSSQITPRLQQYLESRNGLAGYMMRTKYAEEFEVPKHLPLFSSDVLADLK